VTEVFKYKAFISYSHRDEKWAAWLHRALEAYRLPRKVAGAETGNGTVPKRIRPVFRDRDELSSSADLADTVRKALAESENLVVVCSPAAAASRWVNEEIRHFAALGRQDGIYCMVVDGDPAGDGPNTACFPPALAEIGMQEPLAADVRPWADGKRLSRLKLIAGMLGLPLDQLRRRDLQKRQRTWALAALASVVVLAIGLAAVTSWMAAEQRRVSGESLVAYKLNELRTLLNVAQDPADLVRLETWDQEKLARLVAAADEGERTLVDHAMESREKGIDAWRAGDLLLAMERFQDSWALLATAHRRDDSDLEVFFEVGQAEYWIGQVYRDLNALETARDVLTSYAEITRQLIVQQPENAEWVLEMAFALSNLGSVQRELDVNNPERALQLLQSALEYNQIALVLDPNNEYYQSELGQSHAFLADAQRDVCDLDGAYQSRGKQIAMERAILAVDPEDTSSMRRLAFALSGFAVVLYEMGHTDEAKENWTQALQFMAPVLQENPGVRNTTRFMLDREHRVAMMQSYGGDSVSAQETMRGLQARWEGFLKDDGESDETIRMYADYLLNWARLARAGGDVAMAEALLEEATDRIIGLLEKHPGDRGAGNLLVKAVFPVWEMNQAQPSDLVMAHLPNYQANPGRTRACADASLAARQAVMQGDTARARELVSYLQDSGYTEVSFMRFCRKYALCEGS
jgi:tetratricopeptide (TPR) repeat protein